MIHLYKQVNSSWCTCEPKGQRLKLNGNLYIFCHEKNFETRASLIYLISFTDSVDAVLLSSIKCLIRKIQHSHILATFNWFSSELALNKDKYFYFQQWFNLFYESWEKAFFSYFNISLRQATPKSTPC